jgi:hypothetical protein
VGAVTKLSAVFWLGLVLASGFATFMVKYAVQGVDDRVQQIRKQTVAEQQEIRVLTAEWTYLNQPERLADLNERFLHFAPITAQQLQQTIAGIPLRAPAPAAPAPAAPVPAPAAVVAVIPRPGAPRQSPTTDRPIAVAAFGPLLASADVPVPVATVASAPAPASLDALFALVAEKR